MIKKIALILPVLTIGGFALAACDAGNNASATVATADASHGGLEWTSDYDAALAKAKAEDKQVLLDFTGSDWCIWCKRMDADVLSKPEFVQYAKEHLVPVIVDFPKDKELSAAVKEQNAKLKDRFGIKGFPTFVVLDKDGKEVKRFEGYVQGGPQVFVTALAKAD